MRFQFDPDVSGAVVLALLSAVIAVVVYGIVGSELAYWRHPFQDGMTGMHIRLLSFGLLLVLAAGKSLYDFIKKRKGRD